MIHIEVSGFYLFGFALVISAVSIVLQEYIKEIFKWIPRKVWKYSYSRWGGTGIFHRSSVKKYKKYINGKYSIIHVPFRPGRPLVLRNIYVPLKLHKSQIIDKVDSNEAIKKFKKIAVIGEPGSGKSTMLRHLLISFIQDPSDKFLNYSFPILLELNRLTDPSKKLYDELLSALNNTDNDNKFPNGREFLNKRLENGNLIILMDGLDEVAFQERNRVIKDIKDFVTLYSKISFVITCRSAVYNNAFLDIVEQTLEIAEFDDIQISQFLTSWEKEIPPHKSVQKLLNTLHDRPRIMELARNPLMLTIIAYLYCDTDHELPHSRAEFYKKSCDVLLDLWHNTQNNYSAASKHEILKHLALFNQINFKDQNRKTIDYMLVMEEIRSIMPLINKDVTESERILKEIVERSGLLITVDGGYTYQFAHLTLQEYFAAEALSDKKEDLINYFSNNPDTWRETVKLWCGLSHDCSSLITELYQIDPTLSFECLADAVKVDNALADSIIDNFESNFTVTVANESIQKAFGAVASNIKTPRGFKTFRFLVSLLENGNLDSNIKQCAAFSLTFTNLPEAANALVHNFDNIENCENMLIKMGNIAVAALENSKDFPSIKRIEIYLMIGTPAAAKAIIPYLWHNENNVAYTAAWGLGFLLKSDIIEQTLKTSNIEIVSQSGNIEWIWTPFEDSSFSNLPKICGRIGYILNTFDPVINCIKTFKIDNRICVPLFLINLCNSEYMNLKLNLGHISESTKYDFSTLSMKSVEQAKLIIEDFVKKIESNINLAMFFNSIDNDIQVKILSMLPFEKKISTVNWTNQTKSDLSEKYKVEDVETYSVIVCSTIIAVISYGYLLNTPINYLLNLTNIHISFLIGNVNNLLISSGLTLISISFLYSIFTKIPENSFIEKFLIVILAGPAIIPLIVGDMFIYSLDIYNNKVKLFDIYKNYIIQAKSFIFVSLITNYFFIICITRILLIPYTYLITFYLIIIAFFYLIRSFSKNCGNKYMEIIDMIKQDNRNKFIYTFNEEEEKI